MRSLLSPSFTTNKIKTLFQIMDRCGKRFVEYYLNQNENLMELEMQDCLSRYTNDVIASSVFGAEVDSIKEPNNEFYLKGKQATDLTQFPTNLKLTFYFIFPNLYKVRII